VPNNADAGVLTRGFLQEVTTLERTSIDPPRYLVDHRGRNFLLERKGACDFKACEANCCRMICLNLEWNDYLAGFAEKGTGAPLIYRTCRYLSPDFTCRRWGKGRLPRPCDNFPVPGDPMYLEVINVCSFSFVIVQEKMRDPMDRQTE